VWRAGDGDKRETTHVSERRFIADENAEEELIKPGASAVGSDSQNEEVFT
jgi:hypothetical protein